MHRLLVLLFLALFNISSLYAAQSTITESEGYACMGEDKSRKQTEQTALTDAKKKAVEKTTTYIKSETHVKNFELEKDIVAAYANANVKIIQELEKKWYKDDAMGDCLNIKIKAEIIPDEKALEKISKDSLITDDPSVPLYIKMWSEKKEYKQGEKMKVYIKSNKPFYARVVYKDAAGKLVQLLPNPHRENNYFNGGVVYEIPSGEDKFELEVAPPFGKENIIVYASTSQLGEIDVEPLSGVYDIKTRSGIVGIKTRGVVLKEKPTGNKQQIPAEFSETAVFLKTTK
ncbi:MAG: DUF4384 domain-containing protein [Nitrospiraceae bacterium]|nr:DUF4384 domain-containing protein [Nitrospiraceae bacterium]